MSETGTAALARDALVSAFAASCRSAVADPSDAGSWYRMAVILDQAQLLEDVDLERELTLVARSLGLEPVGCMTCLDRALRAQPDFRAAWKKRAEVCRHADDVDGVAEASLAALRLGPRDVDLLCWLAEVHHVRAVLREGGEARTFHDAEAVELGRAAFEHYSSAVAIDEDAAARYEAFYWLGELSEQLGQPTQASGFYRRQAEKTGDEHCWQRYEELRER